MGRKELVFINEGKTLQKSFSLTTEFSSRQVRGNYQPIFRLMWQLLNFSSRISGSTLLYLCSVDSARKFSGGQNFFLNRGNTSHHFHFS